MPDTISFKLNDKPVRLNVDGDRPLLWVLRTDLGLTGTKYGCGEGHCGCCTVLVNKIAVAFLPAQSQRRRRQGSHDDRRTRKGRQTASVAEGFHATRRDAMRLLHARHDYGRRQSAEQDASTFDASKSFAA